MTWKRVRLLVGVLGECPLVRDWLDSKDERSPYLPLKLIDGLVRGFSQVVFANSTVAGALVVLGLALADVYVCAAGVLAAAAATITATVFRQPWTLTGNGLMTYNGVLVGTVTQALTPGLVEASGGPAFIVWLLIALGGAVSAPLTSAMANLCKGVSVPAMTVPFNLIGLLIFTNLPALLTQPMTGPSAQDPTETPLVDLVANATAVPVEPDWLMMLRGSLVSMGQVWAVESVACSTLMYVGVLLNSPILALALYGGSFIGSVCGMGLADDYQQVYSGLWGYNGALTAAAVGAVIFIPTCLSLLTGCLAVIFTAGSQKAFSLVMGPAGLPIFTFPFVTTAAMFLAVSSGSCHEALVRSFDGRPPESQRRRHDESLKMPIHHVQPAQLAEPRHSIQSPASLLSQISISSNE